MGLISRIEDIQWTCKGITASLQTVSRSFSITQRDRKGNIVYDDDGTTPKMTTVTISYDVPVGSETWEASFLTEALAKQVRAVVGAGTTGAYAPTFWITETNLGNMAAPSAARWSRWTGHTEVSYQVSITRSAECGGYTVSVTKNIGAKDNGGS